MLSRRCRERNETIIPKLMGDHGILTAGDDPIDMGTAENWLIKHELTKSLGLDGAVSRFSEPELSYAEGIGGSPAARVAFADLVNAYFEPCMTVLPSHIVLGAGGNFALTALIEQICDPGDRVLIAAPYWSGLDICFSVYNEAQVLPVHIPLEEFFGLNAIRYYEEALKDSVEPVKAVLMCNPHNPLGQCYPKPVLQAMLDFCARHNLHYISDEIYALSIYGLEREDCMGSKFVSALSLEGHKHLVHVIYSLSKDFGCSGFRLGALICQENASVRLSTALSTHSQVSTAASSIASRSILPLDRAHRLIAQSGKLLDAAYATIEAFLVKRGIDFVPAYAGIFIFARLCPCDDPATEQEFQSALKARNVHLASGTSYHFHQRGWFRVVFALPSKMLEEGLARIENCIAKKSLKA